MSRVDSYGEIVQKYNQIRLNAELAIAKAELTIAKANVNEINDLLALDRQPTKKSRCHHCADSYVYASANFNPNLYGED